METRCFKCLKPLMNDTNSIHGVHRQCFKKWFGLSTFGDFTELNRESAGTGPSSNFKRRRVSQRTDDSFFHGKFRKYSASLSKFKYILKVRDEAAPELPPVEYVCNQIARSLEIPVPDHYFLRFHNEPAFVTRNFMSQQRGNADLKHILHYINFEKQVLDCETLVQVIADTTKRFTDVETFVKVCIFDALVGNHDRHARNLGFVVTARNTKLAPISDNTSYLGNEKGEFLKASFNPSGNIFTKHSITPKIRDYVQEFYRLELNHEVRRFVKNIYIKDIKHKIQTSFCSKLMKEAFEKLVDRRYQELKDELRKRS